MAEYHEEGNCRKEQQQAKTRIFLNRVDDCLFGLIEGCAVLSTQTWYWDSRVT